MSELSGAEGSANQSAVRCSWFDDISGLLVVSRTLLWGLGSALLALLLPQSPSRTKRTEGGCGRIRLLPTSTAPFLRVRICCWLLRAQACHGCRYTLGPGGGGGAVAPALESSCDSAGGRLQAPETFAELAAESRRTVVAGREMRTTREDASVCVSVVDFVVLCMQYSDFH